MATNDTNSVTEATNEVALATEIEAVLEHDIGVLEQVLEEVIEWLIDLIPGSIIAVVVMSVGLFLSRRARKLVERIGKKNDWDPALIRYISGTVRFLLIALFFLAALGAIGVPVKSFLGALGITGVMIGFGIRGQLANYFAGLMMIGARPFREGDLIEFGPPPQIGRVRDVALTCTVLDTPDNVRIVVPNATIWRNRIYNFSTHGVRAINIPISVPHDVNIRWVEHIAMDVLTRHAAVLNKPEPSFSTTDVAADHIRAKITAWSHVSSMNVFSSVMKEMQNEFEVAELPVTVPSEDIDLKREE